MLSSIHSAGCHTCHVTHTEQSWVVKGLVPVGPSSIPSCIIVTTVWFVVVGRELVNRFTSVVMEIKSFENSKHYKSVIFFQYSYSRRTDFLLEPQDK